MVLIGEVGLLLEFEECKVLRVHHHHEIDTESIHHHVVSLVGIMTDAEVKVLPSLFKDRLRRRISVLGHHLWQQNEGSAK